MHRACVIGDVQAIGVVDTGDDVTPSTDATLVQVPDKSYFRCLNHKVCPVYQNY